MGYYWDHVDKKNVEIDHGRKLTAPLKRRLKRRAGLIEALFTEIERGNNPLTRLYATLLLRSLVQSDQILMDSYGKQVAELTPEQSARQVA